MKSVSSLITKRVLVLLTRTVCVMLFFYGQLLCQEQVKFSEELKQLQEYFMIPGMTALVSQNNKIIFEKHIGYADIREKRGVDSETLFPIASITKVFSGIIAMKLQENGLLSLDDKVNKYITDQQIGDSLLLKHVLSHTSQGPVGKHFFYSSRFGILKPIFEKVSGQSFEDLVMNEIVTPLGMKSTFMLKDSSQMSKFRNRTAEPYIYDGEVKEGHIEYGFSTSAGIVSNASDLVLLSKALKSDLLIGENSRSAMLSPASAQLPYGYGIFNQVIQDVEVQWAYGQYDSYSSLFLRVPQSDLTLVLLANSNLMSDPARLIYGDLKSSLFALSFLKNYIFNKSSVPLFQDPSNVVFEKSSDLERDLVLAQALAESFLARFDPSKLDKSKSLLNSVLKEFPRYLDYANLSLLHNMSFLKDVAYHMGLEDIEDFDRHLEEIGNAQLVQTPDNPYVHIYMGSFYSRRGDRRRAEAHYRNIADALNFSNNWYTSEARMWLKNLED